jgi:hypothetical protein
MPTTENFQARIIKRLQRFFSHFPEALLASLIILIHKTQNKKQFTSPQAGKHRTPLKDACSPKQSPLEPLCVGPKILRAAPADICFWGLRPDKNSANFQGADSRAGLK